MKTIEELLIEVGEDKHQNLSTTSFKFKTDLWDFFKGFEDKVCVEFGTHKGQTTRILSFLFDKVHTINHNENESAKELNNDRTNIVYHNFDLYSNQLLNIQDEISVFLIDAGHQYDQVISDLNRAVGMNCSSECYIVFDDYGCNVHRENVKRAVDLALSKNHIELVKGIGHGVGHNFGRRRYNEQFRILEDFEGVITKAIWHE
jgi:hypothetical protein